jgi:membrane protein YdbS with pleckstrin-like domain
MFMAYPVRGLADGEVVALEVRPHWAYLGWPLVVFIVCIAISLSVVISAPSAPSFVAYILIAIVVLSGVQLGIKMLKRRATSIVLTSIRLIERQGIIGRSTLEIRLERINNISTRYPLLGRLLGFGDLHIDMGGEQGVSLFSYLPRPDAISSIITEQISRPAQGPNSVLQGTPSTVPNQTWTQAVASTGIGLNYDTTLQASMNDTPPQGVFATRDLHSNQNKTLAERLMELDQLRKMGIINEDEFNAKKAQLLQQL